MERYTAMLAWYRRIESRQNFQRMVPDCKAHFRTSMEAPKIGAPESTEEGESTISEHWC
jgi:hypothetical protein